MKFQPKVIVLTGPKAKKTYALTAGMHTRIDAGEGVDRDRLNAIIAEMKKDRVPLLFVRCASLDQARGVMTWTHNSGLGLAISFS